MAASTYNKEGEPEKFVAYLKPTCPFQPGASKVNGMKMKGSDLVKHGKIVKTKEWPSRFHRLSRNYQR